MTKGKDQLDEKKSTRHLPDTIASSFNVRRHLVMGVGDKE